MRYSYHYQRADGRRVFRYDNSPHYPDLPGFPAHKHEDDRVVPAPAPDLSEVLQEIDSHLYLLAESGIIYAALACCTGGRDLYAAIGLG